MTWYLYPPMVALDQAGNPVRSSAGQFYGELDDTFLTILPIIDVFGETMSEIRVNDLGLTEAFLSEDAEGKWRNADVVVPLSSPKGMRLAAEEAADRAEIAQGFAEAAANAAATAGLPPNGPPGYQIYADENGVPVWLPASSGGGGGSGIAGAPAVWPSSFNPAPHSHLVSDLRRVATGSPTLAGHVLTLLNSTSLSSARDALGAGTGNGTSNVVIGTLDGQAMSATRTFVDTDISLSAAISGLTAGNVREALIALKNLIGSGGGSGTTSNYQKIDYNFTTNTWPARSSLGTLPAGTAVLWRGPSFPTIGGTGAITGLDEFRLKTS